MAVAARVRTAMALLGAAAATVVPQPPGYEPEPPPASVKLTHPGTLSARFPPRDLSWTARELIDAWEAQRATARPVPFYLYDGVAGIDAATAIGELRACPVVTSYKHAADAQFLFQLEGHPWRVRDPDRAAFLIAPVSIGLARRCNTRATTARVLKAVRRHPLWESRLADHLFLARDWMLAPNVVPGAPNVTWVHYMAGKFTYKGAWQARLASPYMDLGSNMSLTPKEGAARNVTFFFGGQTLANNLHRGYHVRATLRDKADTLWTTPGLPKSNVFVDVSNANRRLPACVPKKLNYAVRAGCRGRYLEPGLMRRSEFALAIRGDRPGSNRLERCVEYGVIPAFVSDKLFHTMIPFQCMVPYDHIGAHTGEVAFKCNPGRSLLHVLREWPPRRRERARELMRHFARDLLWQLPGSRVAENVLLEATFMRHTTAAVPDPVNAPQVPPCGFRNRLMYDCASKACEYWARTRRVIDNAHWPCPAE